MMSVRGPSYSLYDLCYERIARHQGKRILLMAIITASEARQAFADIMNKVAFGKERVVVERRGKKLVAVVPVEDLALLEEIEDRLDAEAAKQAKVEARRKKEKPIPWKKARRQLGL